MAEIVFFRRADGLLELGDQESIDFCDKIPAGVRMVATVVVKPRSITMNSCLHKYCELVATALNDAGLDMRKMLRAEIDIPWTKQSVKDHLWRPIQDAMTSKESTTEATNAEYKNVFLVLSRHLSEKKGINVGWPNNRGD